MTSLPEKLLSVLAPHRCLVCSIDDNVLCEACLLSLPAYRGDHCVFCHTSLDDRCICASCQTLTNIRHIWAASAYDGVEAEAIKLLKFERARAAAKPLAHLLALRLPRLAPGTVIVPVPTAYTRVRQRGYDQTLLIARELSILLELPVAPLLGRVTATRQVGARKQQRLAQAAQAYFVKDTQACANATILLVDDVLTTGATVRACGVLLKAAGAQTIDVAVVARQRPSAR